MARTAKKTAALLTGARHPYIGLGELTVWLNASSDGAANWTTERVREILKGAGALITLPNKHQAHSPSRQRRTSRRQWYTSHRLLRLHLEELYMQLFIWKTNLLAQRRDAARDAARPPAGGM